MKPGVDGVVISMVVHDMPSVLSRIADAGGKVLEEKEAIGGGFGFFAIFADPNGNTFQIWSES